MGIIKKTLCWGIILTLLFSPSSLLRAEEDEDYPAAYLGPGYRERLSERKQNGYYVEDFIRVNQRQKEEVDKRNRKEMQKVIISTYQAGVEASNGVLATAEQHKQNVQALNTEIAIRREERQQFAAVNLASGFTYIPYSDGKTVYFKDGLPCRIENERVVDEFGNVSIKNTYNMQYNDKRLLVSLEADIKDQLGNVTHTRQWGMQYTGDSVFYGGKDTLSNKNVTAYFLEETDPAGNIRLTHFSGGTYAGKLLTAFSETIEDSIYGKTSFTRTNITSDSYHEEGLGTDGLAYSLDRTNISYNGKEQLTGYHEEKIITHLEGGKVKVITDAEFAYLGTGHQFGPDVEEPDPDQLLKSIITTTVENPDGSVKKEITTTTYDYDGIKLIGVEGQTVFTGQETDWWEFKDNQGHTLIRKEEKDGKVTYSYVNPENHESEFVLDDQVTATLKDGNKYSGSTETKYEILHGKPMAKQSDSFTSYYHPQTSDLLHTEETNLTYTNDLVNNLQRALSSLEHTEIIYTLVDSQGNPQRNIKDILTTYEYEKNANLKGTQGNGSGSGYELTGSMGWMKNTSQINIDYEVILGEARQKQYREKKLYGNGKEDEIVQ